ncbi:hypothetical protein [Chitinophaga arvensicola]|uniref:Uncharacterized protein n=1 Tax=Chitinophaga arvensicola TaxID=29529 RepID=A0A1I0QJR4_9BACT|nr:hypothetical protein [Chitinophaga arvensicola]SEW27179.1 hypothetical protein SAMN04488122_1511 [Chitinophaga arvensicola]
MNQAYFGIIGTLIGVIAGFALPNLKEIYNRRKPLYVEISKMGFSYPMSAYDDLHCDFTIYLYNNSTILKTFLLLCTETCSNNTAVFTVRYTGDDSRKPLDVVSVNPGSAMVLRLTATYFANGESANPDVSDENISFKFKVGEKTTIITTQSFYYSPY